MDRQKAKVSVFGELNADVKGPTGAPAVPHLAVKDPALRHNLNRGAGEETFAYTQLKTASGDFDDSCNGGRARGGHGVQALQPGVDVYRNPRFSAAFEVEFKGLLDSRFSG